MRHGVIRWWRYRLAILCMALIPTAGLIAYAQRTLTPDDLFRLEEIDDIEIAPDGIGLAFVRRRPLITGDNYQQSLLQGNDRADVWLASLEGGGGPINITKGDAEGRGYWMPKWSPDGKYLAMLSTNAGKNISLCVWEKATDHLVKLSGRSIAWTAPTPFFWVDNQRLATVLLPEDEKSRTEVTLERLAGVSTAEGVASQAWMKSRVGKEVTASTTDSGVRVNLGNRPQMQLILIGINGVTQPVQSAVSIRDIKVAPNRSLIAFLEQVNVLQPNSKSLQWEYSEGFGPLDRYQVKLADISGHILSGPINPAEFVLQNSFKWSPDSRDFAFIGTLADNAHVSRVFRGTVRGSINMVTLDQNITPRALVWADNHRLLLLAEHEIIGDGTIKKRIDWFMLPALGSQQSLTERLAAVPGDLLPASNGRLFLGVADGDLWRLDLDSGVWANLTASLGPKVTAIGSCSPGTPDDALRSCVVVSVSEGMQTDFYRVDVASGATMRLARPSASATLAAYRGDTDVAVFTASEASGSFLTIVHGRSNRSVLGTNQFLRNIISGDLRSIEYRSLEGQSLKGWIILPAGYDVSKRYPLVTWVYAGSVENEVPSVFARFFARLNFTSALNLQLLAARGYAVLIPSMPLAPWPDGKSQSGSDPYMELTKGVLPAVDKAINLGIADPGRLAIWGQSYGGYSTYGLVTQTNRFQAAVATAGISDLVSLYGTFLMPWRYEAFPQEHLLWQWSSEGNQIRMGNPPWKDWGRYMRNSPLFYVDRVQTPLLIMHGDMDAVPIGQAEEFFAALYRQGKRARLVRYWGESHVLQSPANIRDFWRQIYAWIDEFCDISRDQRGNLVFDNEHVKSRNGAPALKPEDFAQFERIELLLHPWLSAGERAKPQESKYTGVK